MPLVTAKYVKLVNVAKSGVAFKDLLQDTSNLTIPFVMFPNCLNIVCFTPTLQVTV
jgi:hypothetical protein